MNRESFLEGIRQQYADQIHEAYIECEHEHDHIDVKSLDRHLTKLRAAAKVQGLAVEEFEDLVRATLPDVVDKLDFWAGKKAA